jgi:hypothetical protein
MTPMSKVGILRKHLYSLITNYPLTYRIYYSYGVSDLPDPPVFPMHAGCVDILSRAILGVVDVARIRKEVLYDVMHELADFCRLDLKYGDITGADQDWQCVSGEEVCSLTVLSCAIFTY